jgi:hypothetical protein
MKYQSRAQLARLFLWLIPVALMYSPSLITLVLPHPPKSLLKEFIASSPGPIAVNLSF